DSVANFDDDLLGGEAGIAPTAGDKTAGLLWRKIAAKQDDPMEFGAAELPWVELAKSAEFEKNRVAYAHAYIHSPRGGPANGVVEHCFGLKIWVNGNEVYRSTERHAELAGYESLSRRELAHAEPPDGRFVC